MGLMIRFSILLLALGSFVVVAENIPFAGAVWKLNSEKSNGRTPTCLGLDKGNLRLPSQMLTGSPTDKPIRPLPAQCALVYKFTWSPDGRTMTMTQPELDASFKAVFDKQ
jgi:hypothetical protein